MWLLGDHVMNETVNKKHTERITTQPLGVEKLKVGH